MEVSQPRDGLAGSAAGGPQLCSARGGRSRRQTSRVGAAVVQGLVRRTRLGVSEALGHAEETPRSTERRCTRRTVRRSAMRRGEWATTLAQIWVRRSVWVLARHRGLEGSCPRPSAGCMETSRRPQKSYKLRTLSYPYTTAHLFQKRCTVPPGGQAPWQCSAHCKAIHIVAAFQVRGK